MNTCSHHQSLDQLPSVEAGLDDVGSTEERVPLVHFRTVDLIPHRLGIFRRIWQINLCDRNTFTLKERKSLSKIREEQTLFSFTTTRRIISSHFTSTQADLWQ